MNTNEIKSKQLGMPFGTANNRLKKAILFKYIQKCEDDICFKCSFKIETLEELSIEHKKPWQRKDTALFWDLDNIAFSHLICNIKTRTHRQHGVKNKYDAEGCRCILCRKARMDYQKNHRKLKRTRSSEEEHSPFKQVADVS